MEGKEDIFKDIENDLERRRKEEKEREKQILTKQLQKYDARVNSKAERIVFVAIILVLSAYIVYDSAYVHPSKDSVTAKVLSTKTGLNATTATAVPIATTVSKATSTTTTPTTPTTTTTTLVADTNLTKNISNVTVNATVNATSVTANATKPKLSGIVSLTIGEINKEKVGDDLAYINSVTFTVENGKDKAIFPLVRVMAFDTKIEKEWSTLSRGEHKFVDGIKPGDKQSAVIGLTPRAFSNLELQKSVILILDEGANLPLITVRSDFLIQ